MANQIHKGCPFLLSPTVKPPVSMAVPPGVVTEIFLTPTVAAVSTVMLTVIWLVLLTMKLLTVIPEPKLTAVAPLKLVPVMVTSRVCP